MQRAVHSPGRTNQSVDVQHLTSRSKLHRGVEQCLVGIGDEEVLCALGIAGIDWIGASLELETLDATDGEGCEGQNERLSGGVHEMEEESKVDRAVCLVFRALQCKKPVRCSSRRWLCDTDRSGLLIGRPGQKYHASSDSAESTLVFYPKGTGHSRWEWCTRGGHSEN